MLHRPKERHSHHFGNSTAQGTQKHVLCCSDHNMLFVAPPEQESLPTTQYTLLSHTHMHK